MSRREALSWAVGHHPAAEDRPERMVPAEVPGAVQLDWARAEGWAPWWQHENWRQYRWMEDAYWTYEAKLPELKLASGQRVFLVLGGVDYQFEVRVGDELRHSQEGMFTPVRLELSGYRAGEVVSVRVHPAPKSVPTPDNRDQANRSCKPAVSYEWDFHPRLIPLGMWQAAYVEVMPATYLDDVELRYTLNDALDAAEISVILNVDGSEPLEVQWELRAPGGERVAQGGGKLAAGTTTQVARLEKPALWWPHDQGAPTLYTLVVQAGEQRIETPSRWRSTAVASSPRAPTGSAPTCSPVPSATTCIAHSSRWRCRAT